MYNWLSLQVSPIISLVWPTRLIFLVMGEVLSFGFNLAVLDPSDSKGNDTYCIVAIEDKKMGFISLGLVLRCPFPVIAGAARHVLYCCHRG